MLDLQRCRGVTGIFPKALDGQCYRARKYPLVDPGVGVVCSCRVGSVAEVIAASFVCYIFFRVHCIWRPVLLSSRWSFSPLRFRLASARGMRGCRDSDLSKRLSFYHGVFDAFTRVATASCGDVRFVIPSEVEQSLDISNHAAVGNIKRCLDFARHDNLVGAIDAIARSRFGEPH